MEVYTQEPEQSGERFRTTATWRDSGATPSDVTLHAFRSTSDSERAFVAFSDRWGPEDSDAEEATFYVDAEQAARLAAVFAGIAAELSTPRLS